MSNDHIEYEVKKRLEVAREESYKYPTNIKMILDLKILELALERILEKPKE